MTDRREFLRKLAKGAAYAAPVIYTLSTPRDLMAIITSGMMGAGNVRDTIQLEGQGTFQAPWDASRQPLAPWSVKPPWERPASPIPFPPGGGSGSE